MLIIIIILSNMIIKIFLKKIKFKLKDIICKKIDLSNLYKDFHDHNKNVTFCIKDVNYENKEDFLSYASDVNKCKKSLDFILSKNFKVSRVEIHL